MSLLLTLLLLSLSLIIVLIDLVYVQTESTQFEPLLLLLLRWSLVRVTREVVLVRRFGGGGGGLLLWLGMLVYSRKVRLLQVFQRL